MTIKSILSSPTPKIPIVFASNGAEGQDACNEAIDEMQKNHPETAPAYSTLITANGYRDTLCRLDSLMIK